jgi:hypothetical protein
MLLGSYPDAVAACTGSWLPPVLVTADEGEGGLVMLNDTLTQALLLVFSVAAGSELGSGFSVTYSSTSKGLHTFTQTSFPCP